jgi:mannosyltransferase OCH1-like enzyme
MIPKKIHYCWFGRGKMPELAYKCIDSWKKYLPDYEIKEWNEDNFDLDLYPYTREAYDSRKFAFVTDVVRLYALYHEGGIYMDTDVEVVRSLDKFLHHTAFSGFEDDHNIPTGIMASEKGGQWAKENLEYYNNLHFISGDGVMDMTTNVQIITKIMLPYGLKQDNTFQDFPQLITFYPKDYFCPKNHETLEVAITNNTYTIHHFNGSWLPKNIQRKRFMRKLLGSKLYNIVRGIKHICIK